MQCDGATIVPHQPITHHVDCVMILLGEIIFQYFDGDTPCCYLRLYLLEVTCVKFNIYYIHDISM